MSERNTLCDVALETVNRSLEELLLLLGDVAENIDGPLGTVRL